MGKDSFKRKLLQSKPGLAALTVWRIFRHPVYLQWLEDWDLHTVFKVRELGGGNPDRLLYVVDNINYTSGFFYCWAGTCRGLMVCERFGFTPVPDWTRSPYAVPGGVDGRTNPFEYFFEPVSDVSPEEARRGRNVIIYDQHCDGEDFDLYGGRSEETVEKFAGVNARYIRVRPELLAAIKSEAERLGVDDKTLAAHVRGVEWGNIKGHPIPAAFGAYEEKIDEALGRGFKRVFLATDSEDTLAHFKKKYGDIILCYSDVNKAVSGSRLLPILEDADTRGADGFRLGYEVLRDMLTMTYCGGLVAGMSFVSFAAAVFKRSRGERFGYESYVKQKISKKGLWVPERVEQLRREERKNGR